MKVIADTGKCEGYANCIVAAPDVFRLDDDLIVEVVDDRPGPAQRDAVEEAVRVCPTGALSFVED
jgi:ferredoxin